MYAGHFASALALKTAKPEAPTWALMAGAGLLDLAFGVLVAAGIEGAAPDWKSSHLLNIPWSHGLPTAILLGAAFAAVFRGSGRGVMAVLFAAVLSHWALDCLVHRPDMELWPNSTVRLGFVDLFGPVSGWGETVIVAASLALYALRARVAEGYGRHWRLTCGLVVALWAIGFAGR